MGKERMPKIIKDFEGAKSWLKTTLCLIDAQNIYYTPKLIYKIPVDFKRLYKSMEQIAGGPIYPIIYLVADPVVNQEKFIERLNSIGYHIRIKLMWHHDGQAHNTNWDDEIIEDAMALLPYHPGVIMVSGDHGFIPTLDKWKAAGKNTQVFSFERDISCQIVESEHMAHILGREILFKRRCSVQ